MRTTPLLRLRTHLPDGQWWMRGNTFVADKARNFANQIFFNFQIEAEARRRDDKLVAVSLENQIRCDEMR